MMTTKITIDPALVRSVLGIDDWEHEKYCDNAFRPKDEEPYNMVITDDNIQFQDCCECYFEGLQGIKGAAFLAEEPEVDIDIHRFKDMAIEWCAKQGWGIDSLIRMGNKTLSGKVVAWEGDNLIEDFEYGENRYTIAEYPDKLFAELAAISFVWEQIQKEKKDER